MMRRNNNAETIMDHAPHWLWGVIINACNGDLTNFDTLYRDTPEHVVFGAEEMRMYAQAWAGK